MIDLERSFSIVTLDQLDPSNFVFIPSDKMIEFFEDLKRNLQKYVTINNEYIQIKLQEENLKTGAKNKKLKTTQDDLEADFDKPIYFIKQS